jgi:molybdate transport system ATP-binding protein
MQPEDGLFVRVRHTLPGAAFTLDVEVRAPRGVTILFGPSGSGKSTLLSVIAGLTTPLEGEVRLGSETWLDTKRDVAWPPEHRRVAYVFQSLALFPHMTGLANVAFGIDRGLGKLERESRARECLARFRAAHLAERKPKTYSGGEAQRVALARAFAMSPRVVLLDEPFSALDADLRYEFVADVRTASRDLGVPVLHVTHDRAEARVLGDHVIRLDAGKVVASGPPDDALGTKSSAKPSAREGLSYDPTEA